MSPLRGLVAFVALVVLCGRPAAAQESISGALPSGWAMPLEALVRELGVSDPAQAVRGARVFRLQAPAQSGQDRVLLIRFETPDLCQDQRCLTIDASLDAGRIATHLAVYAGRAVSSAPGCVGPSLCNGVRFSTEDGRHSVVIFPGPLGPVIY